MQKPKKSKFPKKPTLPKGGIKTDNQLKSYESRVADYNKKVADIEKKYSNEMTKYNAFKRRVEKAKNKLK